MKRILFILLLAIAAWPIGNMVCAATENALVVQLRSGQTDVYLLSTRPRLEMVDANVQLTLSSTEPVVSYRRSDVERFYVKQVNTDDVEQLPKVEVSVRQTAPFTYEVNGLPSSETVNVYDQNGRMIPGCVTKRDDSFMVKLNSQPRGIFLIKIGMIRTIKIQKSK